MRAVITSLSTLEAVTALVLLVRIKFLRLNRLYCALSWFLLLDTVGNVLGATLGTASRMYFDLFMLFLPAMMICRYYMMREMFCELYRGYSGLTILARKALHRGLIRGYLLALVAVPLTSPRWSDPRFQCWQFPVQEAYRFFIVGLLFYLLSMARHFNRLPISMPRNTMTLSYCYSFTLAISVIGDLVVLLAQNRAANSACSIVLLSACVMSYIYLIVRLRRTQPADDSVPPSIGLYDAHVVAALAEMTALLKLVARGPLINGSFVLRSRARGECIGEQSGQTKSRRGPVSWH